jgi:short-subunit dehydrogenase
VLGGRWREALEETADLIGGATIIEADLADPAALASFCSKVLDELDSLDILVHNAGIGVRAPAHATEPDHARDLMALNFLAPVEITRQLLPLIPPSGTIVMVSSIAGKLSLPGTGVYASSKHALNAYANILRVELREKGIHVLAFCPGYVSTPFLRNLLDGPSPKVPPGRGPFALTAEQCAEAVRTGILKRKRTLVLPRLGWLLIAAERLCPALIQGAMSRIMRGNSAL